MTSIFLISRIRSLSLCFPLLVVKYDGTTKRFYEKVDVAEHKDGYAITLGGRLISSSSTYPFRFDGP